LIDCLQLLGNPRKFKGDDMDTNLSGKVALVTGGSRGLGATTALALADEGADVAISYIASADKAEAVVRQLEKKGVRAAAFRADQGKPGESEKLVRAVVAHFGRIDILVNNAALAVMGKIDDAANDLEAQARQYQVNINGVIEAIRVAAPLMGDGGRIVTVGSGVALRAGRAGTADYAATKAAVMAYSRGAARDLGARNITVNIVHSGIMDTDMNAAWRHAMTDAINNRAITRFGRTEEIAAGIVFLASPAASYITGAVLHIDGGGSA
jgi:3-oxoacyl-[acyl-carrier protein] reductase